MARTNNLTNFLTDVSAAIKQKTGDNTPIPAANFDTEILSIDTPGSYQEKEVTIVQNGNYNLLPDSGYDALSNVRLEVIVESAGDATSDATMIARHLLTGYSAVVNGRLIAGTMVDRGAVTITATSSDIAIPEGHYTSLSIPIIDASNCADYTECSQALLALV